MDKKEWEELERVVQDQLASKYGLTRSGENNSIITNEELAKIPNVKKDEKPKEEVRESADEEVSERPDRRRTTSKSKRGKK